jgi:hypothetical protein
MDSALHQLRSRLDAQGYAALAVDGELIVMAPATDDGAPRLSDEITCMPNPGDEGRPWFFTNGHPLIEATHVIDAALYVGARLAPAKAGH